MATETRFPSVTMTTAEYIRHVHQRGVDDELCQRQVERVSRLPPSDPARTGAKAHQTLGRPSGAHHDRASQQRGARPVPRHPSRLYARLLEHRPSSSVNCGCSSRTRTRLASPTSSLSCPSSRLSSQSCSALKRALNFTATCLLEHHLLRRTRRRRLADQQHPGRVLVGDHHHDDGRLRRQGARRLRGEADRRRVRHHRRPDAGHARTNHHGTLQPFLLAQDRPSQAQGHHLTYTYRSVITARIMSIYFTNDWHVKHKQTNPLADIRHESNESNAF